MDGMNIGDDNFFLRFLTHTASEKVSNRCVVRFLSNFQDDPNTPRSWKGLVSKAGLTEKFRIIKLCSSCKCAYTEKDTRKGALCGNIIQEGRIRKNCQTPLSDSISMPYKPISSWIDDALRRYGADKFIPL